MQSPRIVQPNLGNPRQQGPRSIAQTKQLGRPWQRSHDRLPTQSSSSVGGKEMTIDRACKAAWPLVTTNPQSIVFMIMHAFWLCRQQACTVDCGFVAAAARGLVAKPRFVQQIHGSEICVRDPRIIAQRLGTEVCAAKSSGGPNPYFAHNIYSTCIYVNHF